MTTNTNYAATRRPRRASCQANLKQIGLGFAQYIQDYDERMVTQSIAQTYQVDSYATTTDQNWIAEIQPYVKSWKIFRCPSAIDDTDPAAKSVGNNDTSYMYNGVFLGRSSAAVLNASALIWAHENHLASIHCYTRPFADPNVHPPTIAPPNNKSFQAWIDAGDGHYDDLHFDGGNFLFCDGHVKWRQRSTVSAREFGLNSDLKGQQPFATLADVDPAQISQ